MVSLRHGPHVHNRRARPITSDQFDQYSELSHKRTMALDKPASFEVQQWVPEHHHRRISAYLILFMYATNTARFGLDFEHEDDRDNHREWGDPSTLRDRIVAGLLADFHYAIPALMLAEAPPPSLTDRPTEPDEEAGDLERRRYTLAVQAWEEDLTAKLERYEEARKDIERLRKWNDWIQEFVEKDGLIGKIEQAEGEHAVPLGDAVYVAENRGDRPSVTVYDPESFFAEYETGQDFPTRVDFAWEIPADDNDLNNVPKIRRITFELVENPAGPDNETPATVKYAYQDGESNLQCVKTDVTFDKQKTLRKYEQKLPGDRISHTDVTRWAVSDGEIATLEDGTPLERFPLGYDFIPVVHVPNTRTSSGYGKSMYMNLIQLFDDIAGFDLDLVDAMEMAAKPMIAVSGTSVPADNMIEAGTIMGIGDAGAQAVPLDTTSAARISLETQNQMRDLLSTISQVPKSVLGRVETATPPSGIAVKRLNRPYSDLLSRLQRHRVQKYSLLIKMVMRIAVAAGQVEDELGEPPNARAMFGDYELEDASTAAADAAALAKSKAASRLVIARVLEAGGIDIGDPHDEAERTRREDAAAAKSVFDATGSDQLAADQLGLKIPETPAPTLPAFGDPTPPQPPTGFPAPDDGDGQ